MIPRATSEMLSGGDRTCARTKTDTMMPRVGWYHHGVTTRSANRDRSALSCPSASVASVAEGCCDSLPAGSGGKSLSMLASVSESCRYGKGLVGPIGVCQECHAPEWLHALRSRFPRLCPPSWVSSPMQAQRASRTTPRYEHKKQHPAARGS